MKSNVCMGFLSGWFAFPSFCALIFSKCSTLNINVFYREERHVWSTLSLLCLGKVTIQRAVLWFRPSLYPKAEGMQPFGMSPTANANYHRDWAQNKTKTPEPSFPVSYVPIHQCLQGSLGLLATQEAQLKERTGWTRGVAHRRPHTQHAQSSVWLSQCRWASMYKHTRMKVRGNLLTSPYKGHLIFWYRYLTKCNPS